MKRALFVSNGHGEEAIAARIASEVRGLSAVACDHLALVGDFGHPSTMRDVGPRRTLPSGGLIAMGNVRNIVRDLGAGLLAHTAAQWRFLGAVRAEYDVCVAIGDVFALAMALRARAPTVFVGTAKSVYVAPYGPFEERIIRRAQAVFVRDQPTAARLQQHGIPAQAPGNAIVDLYASDDDERIDAVAGASAPLVALFPGSRESAYGDARALCAIVRELLPAFPALGAVLSIAPGLDPLRFAAGLEAEGWEVTPSAQPAHPFVAARSGRAAIQAWRGPIGPLISRATIAIGQAGTANEAAAAGGVPVVAYQPGGARRSAWYRRRQAGLLDGALLLLTGGISQAAAEVRALLEDAPRRARMGAIGRERMGPPGGARAIARRIVHLCGSVA